MACGRVAATVKGVLKSARKTPPARPSATPPRVGQADVEMLRSSMAVSRVGLWPPPRRP
jgi:hypothetical protein